MLLDGVSIALLLTTFLGILLMGYTLYTKIVANGGRRKRSDEGYLKDLSELLLQLPVVILNGKTKASNPHLLANTPERGHAIIEGLCNLVQQF